MTPVTVGCLLLSHNKPDTVFDALKSVYDQDYQHWKLVVIDSGVLAPDLFPQIGDPRVQCVISEETEEVRHTRAIAPWCFNRYLPLLKTDLIVYLCDDDVWYPHAFRTFATFMGRNPDIEACYASQDFGFVRPGEPAVVTGERIAREIGGHGFHPMDCRVDYLQLCHRRSLLNRMEKPWWPEAAEHRAHSDGLFLEKIGRHCPIHPWPVKVSMNRRTVNSVHAPLR